MQNEKFKTKKQNCGYTSTSPSLSPSPFHVENPARGGGEGVGGEVIIKD